MCTYCHEGWRGGERGEGIAESTVTKAIGKRGGRMGAGERGAQYTDHAHKVHVYLKPLVQGLHLLARKFAMLQTGSKHSSLVIVDDVLWG